MTQKPHPPKPVGKVKYRKPTGDKHRSVLERAAMLSKKFPKSRGQKAAR
jgi:hypothetical protein